MIAVCNYSTLVPAGDFRLMVAAAQKQVSEHFLPIWGMKDMTILAIEDGHAALDGDWLVALFDDPDQDGALGYHFETGDRVVAKVFVKPCHDSGSTNLAGEYSVSSVLSHEVLEMILDPFVNIWIDGGDGKSYAKEACDAVEGFSYPCNIQIGDRMIDVMVSDFLLPVYFDAQAHDTQFDWLNKLEAPFSLATGGYCVVRTSPGDEKQIFGDIMPPQWRLVQKKLAGRTFRRINVQ